MQGFPLSGGQIQHQTHHIHSTYNRHCHSVPPISLSKVVVQLHSSWFFPRIKINVTLKITFEQYLLNNTCFRGFYAPLCLLPEMHRMCVGPVYFEGCSWHSRSLTGAHHIRFTQISASPYKASTSHLSRPPHLSPSKCITQLISITNFDSKLRIQVPESIIKINLFDIFLKETSKTEFQTNLIVKKLIKL